MKIVKRDGHIVDYDPEKIRIAIGKANNEVRGKEKASKDERWKKFDINEIKERNYKLDISWLKDDTLEDADDLPEPNELISDALSELSAVTDDLNELLVLLENSEDE